MIKLIHQLLIPKKSIFKFPNFKCPKCQIFQFPNYKMSIFKCSVSMFLTISKFPKFKILKKMTFSQHLFSIFFSFLPTQYNILFSSTNYVKCFLLLRYKCLTLGCLSMNELQTFSKKQKIKIAIRNKILPKETSIFFYKFLIIFAHFLS